ncbi:hypothetical protein DICSQDRAFT_32689, partial [Dichomitus squalens LYAD-421 SS1]
GNRRNISDEEKRMVVIMAERLKPADIAEITRIRPSTVRKVLRLWRTTGEVSQRSHITGRPRALTGLEIAYLESLIERKPDMYLSELKQQLEAAYEVRVDETTISRAL